MSRVDVIVPCYKYAHYLRQCVESVLSQSHDDLRVLIIDDASPDNTAEVARQLAAEDSRVEFRRHEANQGHIATYNEGLDWASGDYTLLLSADDALAPGALERAVRLLDENPEAGMAYGRVDILWDDQGPPERRDHLERWESEVIPGGLFIEWSCQATQNLVATPTAVVRTSVQRQIGGYREDLPHAGDMEMWLRFAATSSLCYIHVTQGYYRTHFSNMHRNYDNSLDFEQIRDAFRVFFASQGHSLPGAERVQALALGRLAEQAFWAAYHAFNKNAIDECKAFLRLAIDADPAIESWKSFKRLRIKLALGPKIWALAHPVLDRLGLLNSAYTNVDSESFVKSSAYLSSWPSPKHLAVVCLLKDTPV